MLYSIAQTPIGPLTLVGDATQLVSIGFPSGRGGVTIDPAWRRSDEAFAAVRTQLDEYFAGARQVFALALALAAPTSSVAWTTLQTIPWDRLVARQLAIAIGNERAVRGRTRQRREPVVHRHPVPPRDRQRRVTHRVRRWAADKGVAAQARRRRRRRAAAVRVGAAARASSARARATGTVVRPSSRGQRGIRRAPSASAPRSSGPRAVFRVARHSIAIENATNATMVAQNGICP
jgi:hypothetical protein